MESIEQPFDSITRIGQEMPDSGDKVELIENQPRSFQNGDSPRAESSPLHQSEGKNSLLHGPQNQGLRVIITASIVFAVAVTVALILTIYLEPKQVHGHAAVACDDAYCSEIGLQTLRNGGNAVDAAVAAAFCLGVVNPAHSGIGGGGFAIVHDHKFIKSWAYDFRETAPRDATPGMIQVPGAEKSMGSVGVPGFVKGLYEMHQKHGELPWKDVVEPAVDLAESGFRVSKELANLLDKNKKDIVNNKAMRNVFVREDTGKVYKVNNTMTRRDLAGTLDIIKANPDALYTGSLLFEFMDDLGQSAIITAEDMKNYTVQKPAVIESKFKELSVIGLPPPAGGPLIALILNMMDKLNWNHKQQNDSLRYHQMIETFKFAFGHQGLMGDPKFNSGMDITNLISEKFAEELVKKINDNTTHQDPQYYGPTGPGNSQGTSHISVIDSSELMVSMTLSLSSNFGSKIMLENTGILLNNGLMEFDTDPSSPNKLEPGKRPQSTMSPTLLYNHEHPCAHRIVIGASGGLRVPTSLTQTVINSVILRKNITGAISAPRVHNQLTNVTLYEDGIPDQVLKDLKDKHHQLKEMPNLGMVTAIEKTNDDIHAWADPRKFGAISKY